MDESAGSDQGVLAQESWEQPPRRQRGPAAVPVLTVDGFEGPLDWLLDLARTRRIDLARLSIAALVEAFAEALTLALATPDLRPMLLGRWGDWLVMAADLTLLRSRLLVPADAAAAQDAHEEAERLRQRLVDRAEISRAADWLEGRGQLGRDAFTRGHTDGRGTLRGGRVGDIVALLRAFRRGDRVQPGAAGLRPGERRRHGAGIGIRGAGGPCRPGAPSQHRLCLRSDERDRAQAPSTAGRFNNAYKAGEAAAEMLVLAAHRRGRRVAIARLSIVAHASTPPTLPV